MKVLLALLLLFFLDSAFSLGNIFRCPTFGSCPDGYFVDHSGPTQMKAACICVKIVRDTPCSNSLFHCSMDTDECDDVEKDCSRKEIIEACRSIYIDAPEICDRENQRLRKEEYAETQPTCASYRDQCNRMTGDHCYRAAEVCDPGTTVQLCKNKRITDKDICNEAERQKEKDRAENTKYSCAHAQNVCLDPLSSKDCSGIAKFCDLETAAKWCYKDDTNQIKKISDADCSRVVKESQDLMFGQSKQECWEQVPLCEGGNSEACTQVATFCVKDIVSALCHAKKIKSERICKYAGLEKTTSSSYPGCKFFVGKCSGREDEYCELASHYCDKDTIGLLCRMWLIKDASICKRVWAGKSDSSAIPITGTIPLPDVIGF